MDPYIRKVFSQLSEEQSEKSYYKIQLLHEMPDSSWADLKKLCPTLPKGWAELASLSKEDRIVFCRDFWIAQLPYHPKAVENITAFFARLEDIGVVVAQHHFNDPFEAHMIYALKGDEGFFHGMPPLTGEQAKVFEAQFGETLLPQDYLAFLQIHDGFSKASDSGLIPTGHFQALQERFNCLMSEEAPPKSTLGKVVNPHALIPFYESFGLPAFQCFWRDWYPQQEMGNVYYSGEGHTISDPAETGAMAFDTFLDWFFFYLEAPF